MEENLYPFVKLVAKVLSDRPLFFLIKFLHHGVGPVGADLSFGDPAHQTLRRPHRQRRTGAPVAESGLILPLRRRRPMDGGWEIREHPMSTMIKAEHLTFRYPDEPADHPPVLDDINLEIAAGSFVAILGHNGSGKSTLPSTATPLLTPTQGKLWVDGLDTSDPDNLLAIRGTVGMVFQNPDNQIVASVVEEDVAFGPENMGIPPKKSENGWTLPSKWSGCMNGVSTPRTCSPAGKSAGWPLPASSP